MTTPTQTADPGDRLAHDLLRAIDECTGAVPISLLLLLLDNYAQRHREDPNALGHRHADPRCRGGDWHPPRETAPDTGAQIRGRPWRGARFNAPKDTPKETR